MPQRSNDLNQSQALRRVRAGGAVVPPKVTHSPHVGHTMTMVCSPTYNKPPPQRTEHHTFLRKMAYIG